MYTYLKTEERGAVAIVAIDVPKSLNALNSAVLGEMGDYLDHLAGRVAGGGEAAPRCLIVTGGGEKAFVAGADISEMATLDPERGKAFGERGAAVFRKIETLPCPVIAAVNGYALGGGCELALACDLRIASDNAKFGQPEVGLGIIPGFSGTVRLSRIVGMGLAKQLIFTGKAIRADEALRIGLVNAVVPQAELMDKAIETANQIAAQAPLAVQAAKRCINAEWDMDADKAIAFESAAFGRCFATEDQKNGMAAFLGKSKYEYRGR